MIDGTIEARRTDIAPLTKLSAKHGVFVIAGNHEYYFGFADWMAQLQTAGWRSLVNRHEVLEVDGGQIVIAGVADQASASYGLPGPNLAKALEGIPDAPVILLQHRPKGARSNTGTGVDLQLSGHTHGGMMIGFDRLVAAENDGFVSGFYQLDDMTLYVSNGTALWPGFAFRILRAPELTLIKLRAG